ncbi:MAG: type IV pilin protein [Panacagrimonas sp.]
MKTHVTRVQGFSLIELMIVVVIVGILAALAYPSYTSYVVRSNRADAQQALMRMALQAERHFTQRNSYEGLGVFVGSLIDEAERPGVYTFEVEDDALEYSITAAPVAGKSNADDGDLEIRSDGTKTRDGDKSWSDR